MDKWYYSWNGERLGPVSLNELQTLADKETLQPGDLVWTSGMSEWKPARSVSALSFPDEPPPLPDSAGIQRVLDGQWDDALPSAARWMWRHKPVFFLLGFLLFGGITAALAEERADDFLVILAAVPTVIFFAGFLITGVYSACCFLTQWQRQLWLRQKWESTSQKGDWVQFAEDGGFVRNDGFAAKYTFYPKQDRIELRPIDNSEPVQLKVVLLSEKELAITWNGQTLHFQKPSWWKRVFG